MDGPKVKNTSFKEDRSEQMGEDIDKYTPLKDRYNSIEELSEAVLEDDAVFAKFQESLPKPKPKDDSRARMAQMLEQYIQDSRILPRGHKIGVLDYGHSFHLYYKHPKNTLSFMVEDSEVQVLAHAYARPMYLSAIRDQIHKEIDKYNA